VRPAHRFSLDCYPLGRLNARRLGSSFTCWYRVLSNEHCVRKIPGAMKSRPSMLIFGVCTLIRSRLTTHASHLFPLRPSPFALSSLRSLRLTFLVRLLTSDF
jgi:hypothetical protein